MAFRVKDAHKAYERALEMGAQPIEIPTGPMELRLPAIKGIGGAPLYLIDRYDQELEKLARYINEEFQIIEDAVFHPE